MTETDMHRHYHVDGLERAILEALTRDGKDIAALTPDDLAPVDEFHIGGRAATAALLAKLPIEPGHHVLDIGCGIGGASRHAASTYGCSTTGIDLADAYVQTARGLAARVGLGDRVDYETANAIDLPFADGAFDGAYTIHVAMNIEDKARLYAEAFRVVRPGGYFALYDIFAGPEGTPILPAPWASDASISFVWPVAEARELVERAGFVITAERDLTDLAQRFFAGRVKAAEALANATSRPAGLHLLMGTDMPQKMRNCLESARTGRLEAWELICRRP